jgi:phenylacetyl-CoA:acceptor oxidoreductase subunit 1
MNGNAATPRWGMVVDLNRCVGCQTCTAACKHANDTLPGVQWRSVLDVEYGTYPDVQRLFLVTGCQHCAEPPCVPVCPSGATAQRADGLVTMDYDLCIGCAYCAVSCPYQARTIVHDQQWYFGVKTRQEQTVAHGERLGVAQKCTFCIERVDEALELGRQPGVDLDYTPACAASCIAQAIHFGDFNDPDSNVTRLVARHASFQMHKELGTDPQIKYLYELDTTPGRFPDEADQNERIMEDPDHPLTGGLQRFWDIRAAMNFILGGMGSGLAFLALLGYLGWDMPATAVRNLHLAAGLLMAAGLTFVWLEIGRKLRILHVLFRPQTSWMTRETYCVGVYYLSWVAGLVWPRPWLLVLTGLAALGFLYCQGRILYAAKGIPAWRAPLVPWLILGSGLLEGWGLYVMSHAIAPESVPFGRPVAVLGMALVVAAAWLWMAYRRTAQRQGIPPLARKALNRASPYVVTTGYILPLLALAFLDNFSQASLLMAVSGFCAVTGGAIWKFTLITQASYQQGFSLPRLPQRGSGQRAAPVLNNVVGYRR